jgi:hypothetical protein
MPTVEWRSFDFRTICQYLALFTSSLCTLEVLADFGENS